MVSEEQQKLQNLLLPTTSGIQKTAIVGAAVIKVLRLKIHTDSLCSLILNTLARGTHLLIAHEETLVIDQAASTSHMRLPQPKSTRLASHQFPVHAARQWSCRLDW